MKENHGLGAFGHEGKGISGARYSCDMCARACDILPGLVTRTKILINNHNVLEIVKVTPAI